LGPGSQVRCGALWWHMAKNGLPGSRCLSLSRVKSPIRRLSPCNTVAYFVNTAYLIFANVRVNTRLAHRLTEARPGLGPPAIY
jgi:hypothetical protein